MAIKINELQVNIHLDKSTEASDNDNNGSSADFATGTEMQKQEQLIDKAVKEVLRILKEQQER